MSSERMDWTVAPDWANWWAFDQDGEAFWYAHEPIISSERRCWICAGGRVALAPIGNPFAGRWQDSLVARPEPTLRATLIRLPGSAYPWAWALQLDHPGRFLTAYKAAVPYRDRRWHPGSGCWLLKESQVEVVASLLTDHGVRYEIAESGANDPTVGRSHMQCVATKKEPRTMNAVEFVRGRFLKASDLQVGQSESFRIGEVTQEELGTERERKLCLHFVGTDQAMALNRTQVRRMIELFGTNTDGWVNQFIRLTVVLTQFKSERVNSFIIDPEQQRPAAASKPFGRREYSDADEPVAEIPF